MVAQSKGPIMTEPKKDISRILREERHLIDEALQRGIDKAMIQHKRAGFPVVVERDGKIEWVMPEDLGY